MATSSSTRHAALCFLLVLALLGEPSFAEKQCWENTSGGPLCIGFLCKATCWMAGKMFKSTVKEHKCLGSTFNSVCYCYLCDK